MSIMRSLHHTMKLENSNFFRLRHSFYGLTPLKFKNFNQKLKDSISTQKFAQKSIMRSLHHTMKLENSNFFRLRHSFHGLYTFEIQEFRPKIETFHKHSKICAMSIMRSLNHTMKLENSNFFSTSSLISWANTFEIQEFRPKIEIFHKHSKI